MSLTLGTRLGIYEVTAKIGEGGMGEVYQARDTTLDRDVALKVLPEAFTADPDRLARFQREAKVLASLNHPNIGGIHGLEESGETQALVLELIEGSTLADRIAEGPVPVEEALNIAKQIADALEAAHDQGIVHRDLKPANVKVRSDGTVKVLDFGLAKAVTPEVGGTGGSDAATMSLSAATQVGMVVGTAAYMSPEQAKGKVVDKRTDIWAFGAVLYEMLTGTRAFPGDDVSDTFASVLAREPAFDALPVSVPPGVRRLLTRCLEKDQQKRLRDLTEGFLQMEDAAARAEVVTATVALPAPELRVWHRPIPAAIGGMVVAAVVGLAAYFMTPEEVVPAGLVRFSVVPPDSGPLNFFIYTRDLVVSPDGTRVIYNGPGSDGGVAQLNVRPIDQLDSTPLRGSEGGFGPFVSPDGEWVGFVDVASGRRLQKVSIFGGPSVAITESVSSIRGASWGTDDQIIFGTANSGLFRVSDGGGEPEALTTLDEGETSHGWPFTIPGRDAVVFVVSRGTGLSTGQLAVLDLNTREVTQLGLAGVGPYYASTGHLVYAAGDGSVRAAPFDVTSLALTGNPVPLVEGVMVKRSGAAAFSISDDGRLVYAVGAGGGGSQGSLVWVDREGREEPLSGLDPGGYESFRLSPDGNRLALDLERSRLWTYDVARGIRNPLTTESGVSDSNPVWTPDGARIVFSRGNRLLLMASDGTGAAEELLTRENATRLIPESWSPDGAQLLFTSVGGGRGASDIELLSMDGDRTAEAFIDTDGSEGHPIISPDGQWVAYHSDVSGRQEVYVQRFPTLGDRQQISTIGGRAPLWSPDGRELFYRSVDGRQLLAVPVTTGTTFTAGVPEVLFEGAYLPSVGVARPYDLTQDGERFLMAKVGGAGDVGRSPEITVVLNWFEELNERVPVP